MAQYSSDIKIAACKDYLSGEVSHREICQKYGITFNEKKHNSMLKKWIVRYQQDGEYSFIKKKGNNHFFSQPQKVIAEEYMD